MDETQAALSVRDQKMDQLIIAMNMITSHLGITAPVATLANQGEGESEMPRDITMRTAPNETGQIRSEALNLGQHFQQNAEAEQNLYDNIRPPTQQSARNIYHNAEASGPALDQIRPAPGPQNEPHHQLPPVQPNTAPARNIPLVTQPYGSNNRAEYGYQPRNMAPGTQPLGNAPEYGHQRLEVSQQGQFRTRNHYSLTGSVNSAPIWALAPSYPDPAKNGYTIDDWLVDLRNTARMCDWPPAATLFQAIKSVDLTT